VQSGKITSRRVVGRNQFFASQNLKSFKRSLLDVKGKTNKKCTWTDLAGFNGWSYFMRIPKQL